MRLPLALVIVSAAALTARAEGPGYAFYGGPGLFDIPVAESAEDAELAFSYALLGNTQRTAISFQAVPRVNATIRFATIDDFEPDGSDLSFRSFDLHFQVLDEGRLTPGVAVGFRDVLGDGIYGSEYIVATKEILPGVKLTGGIGWGRLASDAGFDFALSDRRETTDPGGRLQFDSYFQGDAAFFGGLSWATPVKGLTLKAEYVPDAYAGESANSDFDVKSPFNVGATWAPNALFALTGAYLYGDTAALQITFKANPRNPIAPQDLGAGPAPFRARADDAPQNTAWAGQAEIQTALTDALATALEADGILIEEARFQADAVDLYIVNQSIQRTPKAIGRIARILATALPPSVEVFRITPVEDGLPTTTIELRRSALEAQVDRPDATMQSFETARFLDAPARIAGEDVQRLSPQDRFFWSINPRIPLTLFDTDDAADLDAELVAKASVRVARGLSLTGQVSRFVIGSDQETQSTSTSPLPRVRSDADLYFSGRDIELDRLTADYVFKPAPAVYGRLSGGYLERMFGGISGEVLWAPTASDFALGAEVNYARQREFDSPFGFRDYEVVTGHGSLYWDTGLGGIEAQLDVGRYLAKDWGATLTLSRRFANGWDVSGYITQTDVDFDDFGPGSFAKGVRITMPLRWGLPFESRSQATLDLSEFDRDGGARLRVDGRLYERVRDTDVNTLEQQWSGFWQ